MERRVVLGVSGSIAAYRAADLARDLMRAGFTVRVCLTDAAERFVSRELFEALTGQPCLVDVFEEPERGRMAHIDWARSADLLLIAPASANTLAKLGAGIGDDMLTTIALAYVGPVLVAPAMNPAMYASETTQSALRALRNRGAWIVEPAEGDVACGENGQGKLASNAKIVEEALALLKRGDALRGKTVLITSGPTREPIDQVRYLSNRSSGKMGMALARAAIALGAKVHLVTGPTSEAIPFGVDAVRVETALEMLAACQKLWPGCDLGIGAAAVGDYRVEEIAPGKIRRTEGNYSLSLIPNPDILASLAAMGAPGKLIGFSAEPDEGLEVARKKLAKKGLLAIAVNDVSRSDIGFDSDENELTLLFADGREERSGRMSKTLCAFWLLEQIASA